ncbi:hypothetical protein D3C81_1541070 [compost metagenome]
MITINDEHGIVPHISFLQLLDQLPDGIIRIIHSCNIITKIRSFEIRGQFNLTSVFRYRKRRMARRSYKLGIKRLTLLMQLTQLLHSNPIHFFIRCAEIVEMIIIVVRLVIILVKI